MPRITVDNGYLKMVHRWGSFCYFKIICPVVRCVLGGGGGALLWFEKQKRVVHMDNSIFDDAV